MTTKLGVVMRHGGRTLVSLRRPNSCFCLLVWLIYCSNVTLNTKIYISFTIFIPNTIATEKDGNHYSEPPTNADGYDRPCLDNEVNIAIPQNEKALEKMGEPLTITYGGARRVL